ncbi:MAG: hypothetical protein ACXVLT_04275 [Flavisolibacter sp.]
MRKLRKVGVKVRKRNSVKGRPGCNTTGTVFWGSRSGGAMNWTRLMDGFTSEEVERNCSMTSV